MATASNHRAGIQTHRELCLAEKRLECDTSCPEWGQPDHMAPSLSAQLQQALHKLLDPLRCQFLGWRESSAVEYCLDVQSLGFNPSRGRDRGVPL